MIRTSLMYVIAVGLIGCSLSTSERASSELRQPGPIKNRTAAVQITEVLSSDWLSGTIEPGDKDFVRFTCPLDGEGALSGILAPRDPAALERIRDLLATSGGLSFRARAPRQWATMTNGAVGIDETSRMLAGEKLFEDQRPFCGSGLVSTITQADIGPLEGIEVGIQLNQTAGPVPREKRAFEVTSSSPFTYGTCPFWNNSDCSYFTLCDYYGNHCGSSLIVFCACNTPTAPPSGEALVDQ